MSIIDLSNSENTTVTLNVTSEAGFDNTVAFYEVNEDGSVFDAETNTNIAPGEDGYTEAALANRTDLSISLPDRIPTEIVTEFEGGNFYSSFIVADGTIEELVDIETEGDPDVFFSITEANFDGVEHVIEVDENILGYEDLVNGGDLDFNDIEIEFSGIDISRDTPSEPEAEEVEEPEAEEVEEPETIIPDTTAGPLGEDSGNEIRVQLFGPTPNDLIASEDNEISSNASEFEGFISFSNNFNGGPSSGRVDRILDITGISENSASIIYDFSDTTSPTTLPSVDFLGDVFSDFSNTIPSIENVSIDSSASNLGINSSAISFDANSIDVNFAGVSFNSNSTLELDIEFADV